MSRIGKLPIEIPSGVTVTIEPDWITIAGSKGTLKQFTMPGVTVKQDDGQVTVERVDDAPQNRSKHGLMRSLLYNMVQGVSKGFEKQLELNGVGYRVSQAGSDLKFNLGLAHDVTYKVPEGVAASVKDNVITISGMDKQQVGQVAAEVRSLKKPEPYKGKGIKYAGERILRKSGKSGKDK